MSVTSAPKGFSVTSLVFSAILMVVTLWRAYRTWKDYKEKCRKKFGTKIDPESGDPAVQEMLRAQFGSVTGFAFTNPKSLCAIVCGAGAWTLLLMM